MNGGELSPRSEKTRNVSGGVSRRGDTTTEESRAREGILDGRRWRMLGLKIALLSFEKNDELFNFYRSFFDGLKRSSEEAKNG
jgi:hypothetical protein